jgi:hypothetical protein
VHPTKSIQERRSWDNRTIEPTLEKLSIIDSGATTIGSTGRAPDDNRKHQLLIGIAIDFIVNKITLEEVLLPSGEICDLLKNNSNFFDIETVKQGWRK